MKRLVVNVNIVVGWLCVVLGDVSNVGKFGVVDGKKVIGGKVVLKGVGFVFKVVQFIGV